MLQRPGTVVPQDFMCIGDGRMRTMHSIGYAMSQFDIEATFIFPPEESPRTAQPPASRFS